MIVTVNGVERDLPDATTLEQLVEIEGLASAPCAAEVNKQLVRKKDRDAHTLRDGDTIELVTLVGGG